MTDYDNVECGRCGRQWYSSKYDKEDVLPGNCPYCYQDEVQKIPEPPTKLELLKENINRKKEATPKKIHEKRHEFKIFLENNRMLISMANVGLIITITISILSYVIFFN